MGVSLEMVNERRVEELTLRNIIKSIDFPEQMINISRNMIINDLLMLKRK